MFKFSRKQHMSDYNSLQKIYHLLYGDLTEISDKISTDTIFYLDKDTGEAIPLAERFSEEAMALIDKIKKKSYKTKFVTLYQEPQMAMLRSLSPHAFKLLSFLVSKMAFDNSVRGVSFSIIAAELSMSSRTIQKAIADMEKWGVIYTARERNTFCYFINPAYAWRGSYFMIHNKGMMFNEKMREKTKMIQNKEFDGSLQ